MDSSWNIGSIGIAGPPLRGPSSPRLFAEPPLSPPVSSGPNPTASAQPLEPATPLAPPMTPTVETSPAVSTPEPVQRPATSLESLLIRFRLLTSDQLDEALREKLETGKDVGAIVVERGWVNEDQLSRLLSYAPAFTPSAEQTEDASAPEPSAPGAFDEAEAEPAPEPQSEALEAEAPAESDPEPETFAFAGPVVSTEPETPAQHPFALEIGTPPAHEVPPALELIEVESIDVEPAAEHEPQIEGATGFSEALVPLAAPVAPEPPADPAVEQVQAELVPLAPVQPAAEPVAEPVRASEPEPAPIAEAVAPEPQPEPVSEPEPAPVVMAAPEPQAVRFVEPPAIETIARVFVRLSNGERVEAGSFDDVGAAKARAGEVVREISEDGNGWPFFGGRYIRPEVIVSVDVDATVVRYS